MEEQRARERELVLAPNEYCYVLDTTKGHINCYVGPNKTSLAQTDQPVYFNPKTKRFEHAEMNRATALFATAPANWYMILKNPAKENAHPNAGQSNSAMDLEVGKKINVAGPTSFPLWPGQMAKVIQGHRLKSNQYLHIQIYDPEQAQAQWATTLGRKDDGGEGSAEFVTGQKFIIKGSDVSFYVPPSGVEVIPDDQGNHVRDAVTLQRLEYCILVGEDGRKNFLRGEAVVFPDPNQHFLVRQGRRKFKAIELSDTTGLYIKVIAPYADDDGTEHKEGEELFMSGRDVIYFPRDEHAIIRYGKSEIHQAIAIPRGEGRYVLNRQTGDIRLEQGPRMFLPDPRHEVLTRRILTEREVVAFYPGNAEAMAFNQAVQLNQGGKMPSKKASKMPLDEAQDFLSASPAEGKKAKKSGGFQGDAFARSDDFEKPRTITLNNKYDGAVTIDVWTGYAVQVVNRAGERRVIPGPARILLEYDETLETLNLSTGIPKNSHLPLSTAYLRVAGNKVSDEIEIESSDLVKADLQLKYRVNFEGDPSLFFQVDDYVKLLCDHAMSRVKAAMSQHPIHEVRSRLAEMVRDALLGEKDEDGNRKGLVFSENGMRVYDVEVLDLNISDPDICGLLENAEVQAVRQSIVLSEKEALLDQRRRTEEIERQLLEEAQKTQMLRLQLKATQEEQNHLLLAEKEKQRMALEEMVQTARLAEMVRETEIQAQSLTIKRAENEEELRRKEAMQELAMTALQARVDGTVTQAQAFSPQLVQALNRLGDEQMLAALSENFGEIAAIEGKGLLETAKKFLDFVPNSMVPTLKNGESN